MYSRRGRGVGGEVLQQSTLGSDCAAAAAKFSLAAACDQQQIR
jgi:hypothetical protein